MTSLSSALSLQFRRRTEIGSAGARDTDVGETDTAPTPHPTAPVYTSVGVKGTGPVPPAVTPEE